MITFRIDEVTKLVWALSQGVRVGFLKVSAQGYWYAYTGDKTDIDNAVNASPFSYDDAKSVLLAELAGIERANRKASGKADLYHREGEKASVPCSCGSNAHIRGRYCTQNGLPVWRYETVCENSSCDRKLSMCGDIFSLEDVKRAWQWMPAAIAV